MPLVPQAEILDLDAALRLTSHRARVLTSATGVAIALAHEQSMICRASVGPNAPSLGSRLDVSSGLSGECVRTGKALRCDDSEADPRVDLTSCRRLGIRSLLAAPILLEGEVVGILEIFSPQSYAFDDSHVAVVKALADNVFIRPPALKPTPQANLPVETEPAHNAFQPTLVELLLSSDAASVALTCPPAEFWSDVFVSSPFSWKPFAQSLALHVVMLLVVGNFLTMAVSRTRAVYPAFNRSDVVYYLPSEYFRTYKGKAASATTKRQWTDLANRAVLVRREQRSGSPALIRPPDIKLKRDIGVLRILAWSSVLPGMPASALSHTQLMAPATLVDVIGPPPETATVTRLRVLATPTATVIAPPPSLNTSFRHSHSISIGLMQVVSPAPQMPARAQNSNFSTVQASLRGALISVVAPPPSVSGLKTTLGRHTTWVSAAATQPVPPPPQVSNTANASRWSQHDTPILVVPPPPSAGDFRNTITDTRAVSASTSQVLPPAVETADKSTGGGVLIKRNIYRTPQSVTEGIAGKDTSADTKEVTVAFLGPVLPLPRSSYFSSSEIFLAEERLGNHQKRLIKLVYDFLPYQRRLSDYGPNYPEVEKLRVTRDVNCDETLMQVASSAGTLELSSAERRPMGSESTDQQTKLPCFRTTADDYRRARIHPHK